jgi:hypothetical protein
VCPRRLERLVGAADRRAGFRQELLARSRQRHPARVALEQSHAELAFQVADRLRNRRLGHVECARCRDHLTVVGDGDEVAQMSELEPHSRSL